MLVVAALDVSVDLCADVGMVIELLAAVLRQLAVLMMVVVVPVPGR